MGKIEPEERAGFNPRKMAFAMMRHFLERPARMPNPEGPANLSADQVKTLTAGLSHLRHQINNHLSLIMASAELIKMKPEMADKLTKSIVDQPAKISQELTSFSQVLEKTLRDAGAS
jgi:hypothetical protein